MSRRKTARQGEFSPERSHPRIGRRQRPLGSPDEKRRLLLESLEKRILLAGDPTIGEVEPLPASGQSVSAAIDRLIVKVNEDLDPISANDLRNWRLIGAGRDNLLDTPDDVDHSLALATTYTTGTTLVLDIDARAQVLQPGLYRFTATADLVDLEGNPLDGNDDGVSGDDYVTTFTVAAAPGDSIETPSNDSGAAADPLDMVESPPSSGYVRGFGLGSIQAAADVDYWSFDALAGDRIAIAVDTPDSNLNPLVQLRNSADGTLTSNENGGPDGDALISFFTVTSSGSYTARVTSQSDTVGDYQLRVDVARGIDIESDAGYANDTVGGADRLNLSTAAPGQVAGTVAGTVMADEGSESDEDYFALGILDPGSTVNLAIDLPNTSTLGAQVSVVDASGTALADSDGDSSDSSFTGPIATAGEYFAVVSAGVGQGPRGQYLLNIDIGDAVPPRVTTLSGLPDEGATSSDVISSLSLSFSEPMDPDTVLAAGAFDLREKGPDATFGTSDDITVDLVLQSTFDQYSTSLDFFLESGPLASGDYRFTVANSVRDRAGNPIDGDGDGAGGDPFQRNFRLDLPADFVLEGPDNNVIANATALTLNEDPAASGYFTAFGLGSQDPAIERDNWSDPDYWRFDARAGDVVRVSVETPGSGVDPYVELRNASDSNRQSDDNGGPGTDALTNGYVIPSDGAYYLRVGKNYWSTTVGTYQFRLDVARGLNLESDVSFNNDSVSNADPLGFSTTGNVRTARVAGAVMLPEGSNNDEDRFNIGLQTAGNQVELSVDLPSSSALAPQLRLVDASGVRVPDADGDPTDGHFRVTLAKDDVYYAEVRANDGEGLFGTYVLNVEVTDPGPPEIRGVNRLPLPLAGSDAYRDGVIGEDPSVYLRLSEASGTTLADSSGHPGGPLDATVTGSPAHAQSGPFGDSGDPGLRIGGDSHIEVPDGERVDDSRQIAFSFWMNADSFANTWMPVVFKGTTSSAASEATRYGSKQRLILFRILRLQRLTGLQHLLRLGQPRQLEPHRRFGQPRHRTDQVVGQRGRADGPRHPRWRHPWQRQPAVDRPDLRKQQFLFPLCRSDRRVRPVDRGEDQQRTVGAVLRFEMAGRAAFEREPDQHLLV